MRLLQAKWCLIVSTINPISHSHPVHHGTVFNALIHKFVGSKRREMTFFAHYFRKQNANRASLVLNYNWIYFSPKGD